VTKLVRRPRSPVARAAYVAGCLGLCAAAAVEGQVAPGAVDWPACGHDVQGTRYLPASTITPENVRGLEVAWTYRTREADPDFATRKPTAFETPSSSTARCSSTRRWVG
jgi:glucose dehydrogenase